MIKFIGYSIIGAVIFMMVWSLWTNPDAIYIKTKILEDSIKESKIIADNTDPLMKSCISQYEIYSEIGYEKTGARFSIIRIQKVNSLSELDEFVKLYGLWGQSSYLFIKESYPLIVMAIKTSYQGNSATHVIECGNDGKLTEYSKRTLTF